jgi:uncharacterized membrane protein
MDNMSLIFVILVLAVLSLISSNAGMQCYQQTGYDEISSSNYDFIILNCVIAFIVCCIVIYYMYSKYMGCKIPSTN